MRSADLLVDAFGRVQDLVHDVVEGLSPAQLAFRPATDANSVGWLVWHLTRVQDDHLADAAGSDQVWTSDGWAQRLNLPFDPAATGFGHGPEEVAAVRVESGELLVGYHDAVHEQTVRYVRDLDDSDLDRIVDRSWTPAVSLGTRLVSVIGDELQHVGQAAYLRGLLRDR